MEAIKPSICHLISVAWLKLTTSCLQTSLRTKFQGISKKYVVELKDVSKEASKNVLSNDSQVGMNIELLRWLF